MGDVIDFRARAPSVRTSPRLHVWRYGSFWELHHESGSGESWALLDRFETREQAVQEALDALHLWPGAKLGRISE